MDYFSNGATDKGHMIVVSKTGYSEMIQAQVCTDQLEEAYRDITAEELENFKLKSIGSITKK